MDYSTLFKQKIQEVLSGHYSEDVVTKVSDFLSKYDPNEYIYMYPVQRYLGLYGNTSVKNELYKMFSYLEKTGLLIPYAKITCHEDDCTHDNLIPYDELDIREKEDFLRCDHCDEPLDKSAAEKAYRVADVKILEEILGIETDIER